MASESLTPDVFLDAVVAALGAHPEVGSAHRYTLVDDATAGPIVLVDLAEIEHVSEVDDTGWEVQMRLEVIVMCEKAARGTKLDAMVLAQKLALLARWNTWGLAMLPAQVKLIVRDEVTDIGRQYDAARIEFEQRMTWETAPATDTPITEVYAGVEPDTGLDHVDDYFQLVPEDPSP